MDRHEEGFSFNTLPKTNFVYFPKYRIIPLTIIHQGLKHWSGEKCTIFIVVLVQLTVFIVEGMISEEYMGIFNILPNITYCAHVI